MVRINWQLWLGVVLAVVPIGTASLRSAESDGANPSQLSPPIAAQRPTWKSSRWQGSPSPPSPFVPHRIYPQLELHKPIYLAAEPGTSSFLLVEHGVGWHGPSRIYRFDDRSDVTSKTLLYETPELIYSLAFHPQYQANGILYLFTNARSQQMNREDESRDRIVRFEVARTEPREFRTERPELILEWWSNGHDGGGLAFGPDGMLYVATGDGSGSSDQKNHGQRLNNLNAKILRLDVDHPAPGQQYGIPVDNPFVSTPGASPEIWAYGLRNPWRLTYDHATNQLWAGNNGQDLWESVYLIRRGANYGWPIVEGNHPFQLQRERGPNPISPSTADHSHAEARSLTGGIVYHGQAIPELQGAYLYADFSTGKIWALRHDGQQIVSHQEIADTTLQITCFAQDGRGELILVDHEGGLSTLVPRPAITDNAPFPFRLSESGAFTSTADHITDPGLIPYSVNSPQWVDGASIRRWIGLPGDGQIEWTRRRAWRFPEKTVLLQTLSLEMQTGNPTSRRRIETRVLTLQQGEWVGYSYRWNQDQTDAELVASEGSEEVLGPQDVDGTPQPQVWRYPSRAECAVCHNRAVDYVLGISTLQMNREIRLESGEFVHQIDHLSNLGAFVRRPDDQSPWPSMPHPFDTEAPLHDRVRAYLHANCHHCHVREGGGNARLHLEFPTPGRGGNGAWGGGGPGGRFSRGPQWLAPPEHGHFKLETPQVVKPGFPDQSVLYYRMSKLGQGRMPYAGTNVPDHEFLDLLWRWMDQGEVEKSPDPAQAFPPVDATANNASPPPSDIAAIDPVQQHWREQLRADAPIPAIGESDLNHLLNSTSGALLVQRWLDRTPRPSVRRQETIQRAMQSPREEVRDLFERYLPLSDRRKRLGPQIRPSELLSIPGDVDRGRELYFGAAGLQCRQCHTIAGEGQGVVGPDLKSIGRKFAKPELLDAILDPSKTIDARYQSLLVTLHDGRVFTGIAEQRDEHRLTLRDSQNQLHVIANSEIATAAPSPQSIMPTLQLQNLTAKEAADLLEFLSQLRSDPTGP